jgi:hypothetical protein
MYALTDLGITIADIQQHNKSGVLMVSGQSTEAVSKTYSLRFESGELARLSGPNNLLGQEALVELLALKTLTPPRWFPLNASAGWSGPAQIRRQDLSGLLGLAIAPAGMSVKQAIQAGTSAAAMEKEQAAAKQSGEALLLRVMNVFANVYIGDAKADLLVVAKRHPPGSEPAAFIDECVHLLEPMLGEEGARALLS